MDRPAVVDYGVIAANTYRTAASHFLLVGDTVTVAGNGLAGANVTGTGIAPGRA